MSSERLRDTPEQDNTSQEQVEQAGAERRKELHEQREKRSEQSQEGDVERAREALKHASQEREPKHEHERPASPAKRRITQKDRDASYSTTMKEVRTQMSAPSRTFSKFIHSKAVEKTSEVVGSTVARPNAILAGAIFAFILTLGVYLVAKNLGYPLSGFETIAAFVLGWILGLAYDFVKNMVTGRQ